MVAPLLLGRLVATPGALRLLKETAQVLLALLARHFGSDRGDIPPEDGAPWRRFDARESPPPSLFEEVHP